MDSTRFSIEDLAFLRQTAREAQSSQIPFTEFFGVKTFERLTGLSCDFIRKRMQDAGCRCATGGNKEAMFLASDYARILGGLTEEE